MVIIAVCAAFAAVVFAAATWPPRWSPMLWRDVTRPLRRRLRPSRYRYWW